MAPSAKDWFLNLTFVRLITGRRQPIPRVKAHSLEDGIPEKFAVDSFQDTAPELPQVHSTPNPFSSPGDRPRRF
jgi:hypothetical protein